MSKGVTIDIGHKPKKADGKNGYTSTDSYVDDGITVEVVETKIIYGVKGYKKVTHTPKGAQISRVQRNGSTQNGLDEGIKVSSNITIFYWNCDDKNDKPLLVQLGQNYYACTKDNEWAMETKVNTMSLQKILDKLNCTRNTLHVVNINRITGNTGRGQYRCPACEAIEIKQVCNKSQNGYQYTSYTHTPQAGKIGNIRNGELTICSPKDRADSVAVYWYPRPEKINSLLFSCKRGGQSDWFSRYYGDDVWTEFYGNITTENPASIQKTLTDRHTPRVIIDFSKPANKPYGLTGSFINFNVTTVNVQKSNYNGFKHTRRNNGKFKITNILVGTHIIQGIRSNGALSSITAFCNGESPKEDNILLIELEGQGKTMYRYFERPTSSTGLWTELNRGSQTGKLDGVDLKNQLDRMNEKPKTNPEVATPPPMPKNGPTPNHHLPHTSEHSHHSSHSSEGHSSNAHSAMASGADNSTSSPPDGTGSTAGTVGAIVGGVIGAALLGILGWKLTPVVKNYVARRHSSL